MLLNHRILFAVLLFALSAATQAVHAQDTLRALDLDAIISEVRRANPDIAASRLAAEAMATREDQVSALPDPMVMFTYQPEPIYTARGTQRAQIRIEQSIPFPGKLGLMGDIAALGAEVGALGTTSLSDNLVLIAKLSYYELYRLQRHERLIHEFIEKLSDYESVAVTQYEVGRGMQQAILKAQLERNTLSKRLLDIAWQRRSELERLSKLVSRPVAQDTTSSIVASVPPTLAALDPGRLVSYAIDHRSELQALRTSRLQADASVDLARKSYFPDFSVNLTYFDVADSDIPPSADGKNALALGVSVKVPLQRGRLHAQLEEARLRQNQVDASIESIFAEFRTNIADILSRLREDERQLTLYRDALIPQAETTLEATLSAYTTGRTDFLNLLDAERVLFTVRMGHEDVVVRYLKSISMLERQLGVTSLAELTEMDGD